MSIGGLGVSAPVPGADETDALWLSNRGRALSRAGVYDRVCLVTSVSLASGSTRIAFRHIVATSIAIAMPEDVEMTPFLLDHRTDRTVREHYDLAGFFGKRSLSHKARGTATGRSQSTSSTMTVTIPAKREMDLSGRR